MSKANEASMRTPVVDRTAVAGNAQESGVLPATLSANTSQHDFPEGSIMWQLPRLLEVTRSYFEIDVAAGQVLPSGVRLSGSRMVPVRVARRRRFPDRLGTIQARQGPESR